MRHRIRTVGVLVLAFLVSGSGSLGARSPCAITLAPPVPGKIVAHFHPAPQGGHFGVDLGSPLGAIVRSPVSGTVTFAGEVAGMNSVTVAPHRRVRVSLSHLSEVWVRPGRVVRIGETLGRTGMDRGRAAVHLSLRVDGRYVDPLPALRCSARPGSGSGKLRLLPSR